MAWIYLTLAGILEIVWAFSMKKSEGFTLPGATILTFAAMTGSFILLALAMKSIPLGTAYPIWTGIGAAGAFLLGIALLGEPMTPGRIFAATLLIAGMIMLKMTTP